jgi:hypothetical protein
MAELTVPPVPPELCGKRGPRFDGAPPTGSCVFTPHQTGNHSWSIPEFNRPVVESPSGDAFWEPSDFSAHMNPATVWTILEVDGVQLITPGVHLVNRFAYVVTEEPWTDEDWGREWSW